MSQESLRHAIKSALEDPQFPVENSPSPDVSLSPAAVVYVDSGVHAGESRERSHADTDKVLAYLNSLPKLWGM